MILRVVAQVRGGQGLQHAVQRVVFEQIAFFDVGGERRITSVSAELLQLSRMDPPIFGGVHRAAFEAMAAKRSAIKAGCGASGLDDPRDRAWIDRLMADDMARRPARK